MIAFLCLAVFIFGIPYACYLIFLIIRDLWINWIHLLDTVENGIHVLTHAISPVESLPGAVHPKDCTCWLCKPPEDPKPVVSQKVVPFSSQATPNPIQIVPFPSTFTGPEDI